MFVDAECLDDGQQNHCHSHSLNLTNFRPLKFQLTRHVRKIRSEMCCQEVTHTDDVFLAVFVSSSSSLSLRCVVKALKSFNKLIWQRYFDGKKSF